jgi:hypothetical protein
VCNWKASCREDRSRFLQQGLRHYIESRSGANGCTHKDPFKGVWDQIFSCLVASPELSSGDIFWELQRSSPGRYQPLQIRTLQQECGIDPS